MKRLFTSVLSFLMAFSLWAEAPQTISYQAVVRNNQGRLLRETNVGVRISILQESENGTAVYTETRTVKTNVNGLMTFAIGDANGITSDTLSNIAWADNSYFLRCDIDLDGGENYTLSSTSQMNSVPYALYAKNIAPEALPAWAQSEDKPVYNYSEIQDAPEVPTKVSELENDANYITINELPKADSLLSKSEASITYQPKGNYLTEHQSLAGYVTKTEASTTYQPKGEYLTEHQSLADYAKKSELPKADSLLSKAEASTTYQPKGSYLTEHQSLADYAKKTEIPTVPTNVSSFTNDAGYLTEHQSLADYAKKSELPKSDSLLSKSEASTTYQPKGSYLTEHQSLAGYAKKSDLPKKDSLLSKAEASTTYQPKGNYLTEHQSLADYAKKSDLPKADSLLSKAEASTTYQPKGNYLTEHQSLEAYAKKTDLPSVPTKVSSFTNDAGYLTEHQSLEDYAKKSDLPKADSLLSKAEASTTYQLKGNYLTEHQSLADYAKKSELPSTEGLLSETKAAETYQPKGNYLTEHQSLSDYAKKTDIPTVPTKVSSFTNDAGYITAADIPTVQVPSLADYAKKSELPKADSLLSKAEASTTYQPKGNYLTEHQSLADYAKKSEIPTVPTKVSSFTNDAGYLTEHQFLADYAKKSDLPKTDSLLSKAEASTTYQPKGNYLTEHQSLAAYAKKTDIPTVPTKVSSFTNDAGYLTEHQSLADYAKKSEIPSVPTKVSSFTNDAGYLTEHQSLADYAKKSELPKSDSLLSKAEASTTYQPKGEYLTEHQSLADYAKKSEIPSVPTKVTSFTNDAGYLTEHQSLADYAKKGDIPSVPTKVSSFTNDAGYLTEHQSLADYAKKTDIPTLPTKVSSFTNDAGYLTEHQSLADYAKKTDIPSVPTKVSSFTNDVGYLTEHQSLADYAKKTDIPTVPTKVSAFENDATYIKKADFDAIIADYNTLLNKYKTELDSLKNVMSNAAASGGLRSVAIDNGALPGKFSVSATKKVKFSMGNLQYQASTKTWRFAANQYDYVGTHNTKIAANYTGWIDLFGWGTSGYDNRAKDSYAKNFYPYSSSTASVNSSYNSYGYGPSINQTDRNLTGTSANYDWGVYNAISNGGNQKGQWRVLTADEWKYLYSGRANAASLRTRATVEGVAGYIFFPDNWEQPEGISVGLDAGAFTTNSYSALRWNVLEAQGAVFLPAAGGRNGTTVGSVGSYGYYWSSTYSSYNYAYTFYFSSNSMYASTSISRYYGHSVRLVQDNQNKMYDVSFYGKDGILIETMKVAGGASAIAPTPPVIDGYEFTGWDKTFTNVQSDLIVTAQYKEKSESPVSGTLNGYEYVDLGLTSATLWATCNAGATLSHQRGTQYVIGDNFGWGTNWTYPTLAQFEELWNECDKSDVTVSGVKCVKFVGPNGNYIVMPTTDYWVNYYYKGNYYAKGLSSYTSLSQIAIDATVISSGIYKTYIRPVVK